MLGVQNEREWRAFCTTVLQQPCLATDPRFASNAQRVAQQPALQSLIDAVFGQLTANEV
ncbi:MAG: CoA transferase, partial [Burkholderiales bacterium]